MLTLISFLQDPRWIMSPMHANPFDSVNIFKDTKCKRAMGIHWGTWYAFSESLFPLLILIFSPQTNSRNSTLRTCFRTPDDPSDRQY